MKTTTYSDFRKNLKQNLDMVNEDHDELIIFRKGNKDVVILSLEDYNSIKETAYLLSSLKNAERLMNSVRELDSGNGIEKHIQ